MKNPHAASILLLTLCWGPALIPSSAVAAEWPSGGVVLPVLPSGEDVVLACGPRAVCVISDRGRSACLVTADTIVPLPQDGRNYDDTKVRWLTQGHMLWPDDRGGVLQWNGSEARELIAGGTAMDVALSPDGRSAIIWPHYDPAAAEAWLYDGAAITPIALPKEEGAGVQEMGWHDGAVRATLRSVRADGKFLRTAGPAQPERDFRVTTDGGRSWAAPAATQPLPQQLGICRIKKPSEALAWSAGDGQVMRLIPIAAEPAPDAAVRRASPFQDPPLQAAVQISALQLSDGSAIWPWDARVVDGRQPWPTHLAAGRQLIVGLYRQLAYHRGAPFSTWEPNIEGWALVDAETGRIKPYDGLGWKADSQMIAGVDGLAQVCTQPMTVLTCRPGGRACDVGQSLQLAERDCRAAWPRTDTGVVHEQFALLARTSASGNAHILLAWSRTADPVVVNRIDPAADVRAIAWSDDGRRLAWIQHGRLQCWSPPAP